MRVLAIAGAICAVTLTVSSASAENKFKALLSPVFGNNTENAFSQASHKVADGETAVPAQQVSFGHRQVAGCADGGFATGGCADQGCAGQGGAGCGGRCNGSGEGFCTPHTVPNLPSSSLRQYWRSSPCDTSVWDGYRVKCRAPFPGPKKRGCNSGGCAPDFDPDTVVASGCASAAVEACDDQAGCATGGCDVPSYATQGFAPSGCDTAAGCDVPGGCDTSTYSPF